jgi:hypothetical protein
MVLHVHTVQTADGKYYWFEPSGNFSVQDGILPDAELHGPFDSDAEALADQEQVLFDGKVSEGGNWDPAWDKPQ